LHIDGRHTYEDVKQDFTAWASKLSDRAIVLFHDVNVRERNFGVWKFWQELRRDHSSFEFEHGHGLGVLAYGDNIPTAVKPLISATPKTRSYIRGVYARLGAGVTDRHALSLGQQERAGLTQILKARDAEVAGARDQIGALDAALQAARQENAQHTALRTALEMHVQEDLKAIKHRDAELAAARGQINTLNGQLQAAHQENRRQAASHNALEATFQKQLQVTRARDGDLAAALDKINELQTTGHQATLQIAALQEELERTRKSHAEEIRKLQGKLAEPSAVESTKMRIIQQQMRTIVRLNQEIIALKRQAEPFQNLLQSTSWRITAPLRAAKIQWNRLTGFR
jgi:chromosome segregation ATPase